MPVRKYINWKNYGNAYSKALMRKYGAGAATNPFLLGLATGAGKALVKKALKGDKPPSTGSRMVKRAKAIDKVISSASGGSPAQQAADAIAKAGSGGGNYANRKRYAVGNWAVGPLGRRFKKYREKKDFFRDSVIYIREIGSTYSDANCVYIGAGMPMGELNRALWRALVKRLFQKSGIEIQYVDRDAVIDSGDTADTHTISIEYFKNATTTTSTSVTATIAVNNTVVQIADQIITALTTSFTTNLSDGDKPLFRRIRYFTTDVATGTQKQFFAQMFLQDFKFAIDFKSGLRIQNITLAGNTTGDTGEDRANVNNVEAVSLRGKLYRTDKWRNAFEPPLRLSASVADPSLIASGTNGIILNKYENMVSTSSELYSKPPPAYMLGTTKYQKVFLKPGKVYVDKLKFNTTIKLNTIMEVMADLIKTNDFNKPVSFGISHVCALEKSIDLRIADSDLTVGYEVNYTLKVKGWESYPKQVPLYNVD